jgi:hypothetical protein
MIKSRRIGWVEGVARMGEVKNPYKIVVGKPEEQRPRRRPGHSWEDNIKIDLKEVV